ncbi:hypothetical protein FHS16_005724 [Paenibacillus endophyticus]|uniref:IS110 family transposase n=1 Tax=Paenibacillus endophyticus TaxID=1294268 RepID=A0A7W5CDB0_9BACL|nr:hypothetical protein [Paenibacillus endophyticus]
MKFKSQVRQNQLIEKITAQHLVVGIDIAQQLHVARAVNSLGTICFSHECSLIRRISPGW